MSEILRTEHATEAQSRFLAEYAETLRIAPAARLAGVGRATVYRWKADPAFREAMRLAAQEFFRRVRIRVHAEAEERKRQRAERGQAYYAARCAALAKARARRAHMRAS